MRVTFDPAASEELDRIYAWIAKDNPRAVELMSVCQMTSFEPVPDDYEKVYDARQLIEENASKIREAHKS